MAINSTTIVIFISIIFAVNIIAGIVIDVAPAVTDEFDVNVFFFAFLFNFGFLDLFDSIRVYELMISSSSDSKTHSN